MWLNFFALTQAIKLPRVAQKLLFEQAIICATRGIFEGRAVGEQYQFVGALSGLTHTAFLAIIPAIQHHYHNNTDIGPVEM
jgi:hypothetical protein